jgi:hypothetical protein
LLVHALAHAAASFYRSSNEGYDQQLIERGLQLSLSEKLPAPQASQDWARCLVEEATNIGQALSAPGQQPARQPWHDKLAASSALFLSASCAQALAAEPKRTGHQEPSQAAIDTLTQELLDGADDEGDAMVTDETLRAVKWERSLAVRELQDAVNLLATELAVASTAHALTES